MKREQERKAQERREVITKRIGNAKPTDGLSQSDLKKLCQDYHGRLAKLEDLKYDLESEVRAKDFIINELSIQCNDLRGKL